LRRTRCPGVRAALRWDAETAKGARLWDDANVLALSLRSTSPAVAREILDAWFSNQPASSEADFDLIELAKKLDAEYRTSSTSGKRIAVT